MSRSHLVSTTDLLPSEKRFVAYLRNLGFGRIVSIPIRNGELVLDPWPTTVQEVRFASSEAATSRTVSDKFDLKRQVVEFFEYVRAVEVGEILYLECRHGIPFAMEVGHRPEAKEGRRD